MRAGSKFSASCMHVLTPAVLSPIAAPPAIDEVLRSVILAPGFDIQLASSTRIPGARSLALSGNSRAGGNVITYVSTGKPGKVHTEQGCACCLVH